MKYMIMSWDRVRFIGTMEECKNLVRRGEYIESTRGQDLTVDKMYCLCNEGRWILA